LTRKWSGGAAQLRTLMETPVGFLRCLEKLWRKFVDFPVWKGQEKFFLDLLQCKKIIFHDLLFWHAFSLYFIQD